MTSLVQEMPSVLEPLRGLEPRIGELGRAELAAVLAPVIERLHERLPAGEAAEVAPSILAFCRRLYANARSGDALPLARAVLAQTVLAGDPVLERRAATVCGLLSADSADVVGAIEHHVRALRLAGDDRIEASGIWNNIGLAMAIAGNAEMAGRCYQRSVDLVKSEPDPVYARYVAWVNLAQSNFQLGCHEEGLIFADRALMEQTGAIRDRDLHVALLLRRNLVRLLVAVNRVDDVDGPCERGDRARGSNQDAAGVDRGDNRARGARARARAHRPGAHAPGAGARPGARSAGRLARHARLRRSPPKKRRATPSARCCA